jgi:hypothetical protein
VVVAGVESLIASTLAAFGAELTSLGVFALVTTIAFFIGGALIGWLSPGWETFEAGAAGALAALWSVFLAARLLDFGSGFFVTIPVGLLWGLLCGLAGGWVGEHIQGPRGRPPPPS